MGDEQNGKDSGASWCVRHPIKCAGRAGGRAYSGVRDSVGRFGGRLADEAGRIPYVGGKVREVRDDLAFKRQMAPVRKAARRYEALQQLDELNKARAEGKARKQQQKRDIEEYCANFPSDCRNYKRELDRQNRHMLNKARMVHQEEKARLREVKKAERDNKWFGVLSAPRKMANFVYEDVKYAARVPQKTYVPRRQSYRPPADKEPGSYRPYARPASKQMDDIDAQFRRDMGF